MDWTPRISYVHIGQYFYYYYYYYACGISLLAQFANSISAERRKNSERSWLAEYGEKDRTGGGANGRANGVRREKSIEIAALSFVYVDDRISP